MKKKKVQHDLFGNQIGKGLEKANQWKVMEFTNPNRVFTVSKYTNGTWNCTCGKDPTCIHVKQCKNDTSADINYIEVGRCPHCFKEIHNKKTGESLWIKKSAIFEFEGTKKKIDVSVECPHCNSLFSTDFAFPKRFPDTRKPECLIISAKKNFWSEQEKSDFEYTYLVWSAKCPFCRLDVNEQNVSEIDSNNEMSICPSCKSRIDVKWSRGGKALINEIKKSDDLGDAFRQLLFYKLPDVLKSKEYFVLNFIGIDDFMDTYMTILHQNLRKYAKICYMPDGDRVFILEKNWASKNVFVDYMKERETKYVKDWQNVFLILFVEDNQFFEYDVKLSERNLKADLFVQNYKKFFKLYEKLGNFMAEKEDDDESENNEELNQKITKIKNKIEQMF